MQTIHRPRALPATASATATATAALTLATALHAAPLPQNLVLANATVWTNTDTPHTGEVVIIDGRIAPPGTQAPANTERRDLAGAFLMPGIQDAHGHILGLGAALEEVDLTGTRSYDEVVERIVAVAAKTPKNTWIRGRGWDQNDWRDQRMPHHADLSAMTMEHPVYLVRVDGHAALANLLAMRASGVHEDLESPSGGEILRGEDGEPTGVFVDRAMQLINPPEPGPEDVRRRLLLAQQEILRRGITCVHDAGVSRATFEEMRMLHMTGKWHLRVYAMWAANERDQIRKGPWASKDALLQARAVKGYADGALGSRGAALLEPYADRKGFKGLLLTPPKGLQELAELCARSNMQLCTHAIGDAANRAVLDAYEAAIDAATPDEASRAARRAALRFRIEHAQIVAPADVERFRRLAVIPSMQPTHLTSDMPWAPARLGEERVPHAYAWRSFLALGIPVPFGSDFPVEGVDPRLGIYAAVTTRPAPGKEPLRPDQVLDREAALRGFTGHAAHAMFAEQELGRIAPGFRADIVVFDENLLTCTDDELLEARVLLTVVAGKIAFAAER